jgi:hypothetical protein
LIAAVEKDPAATCVNYEQVAAVVRIFKFDNPGNDFHIQFNHPGKAFQAV